MYLSKITAVAIIASFSNALASPTLQHRQNGVTCQTSSGSPTTEDVKLVINELKGRGGSFPQTNGVASNCTTLVGHGGAAIAVCGGTDNDESALSCQQVAGYANQIQQTCKSGNPVRVGGTYTVSASKRVEVIHS